MRTLRACAFIFLAALLFSCGGHATRNSGAGVGGAGVSPVNTAHPQTLSDALAQLDALPVPAGVKPEVFMQLKAALREALECRALGEGNGSGELQFATRSEGSRPGGRESLSLQRIVSTPPTGDANRVNDLAIADNGDGTYSLTWHYRNLGDYNQDGSVGVSDITPLAVHYGETWATGEENSIAAVVDGSGNRTVDISDVTQIAMGFGSSVDHYVIEASDAAESDFTLISESLLSSTDSSSRLNFNYSIGEPPTYAYWRIAPVDESDLQGDYSNVSMEFHPDWHIQTVNSSGVISCSSMTAVDGNPAIAYYDSTNSILFYVRASDPRGEYWSGSAVDSGFSLIKSLSLKVVAGRPAIAYFPNGSLKYAWAEGSDGESWNTPIKAVNEAYPAARTRITLDIADGNPAIAYSVSEAIYFVRAKNINGSSWDSPLPVLVGGPDDFMGFNTSMAVINANPTIIYYDNTNRNLKYIRAGAPDGSSWGSAITVDDNGTWVFSLTTVNGCPAIAYFNDTTFCFIRAMDAIGDTWNAPVIVGGGGDDPCLSIVNNHPAVSYGGGDLGYVRANDKNGESWSPPVNIDPWGDVGSNSSLEAFNGHPAISYINDTDGTLKFAIYY